MFDGIVPNRPDPPPQHPAGVTMRDHAEAIAFIGVICGAGVWAVVLVRLAGWGW